MVIVSSLSFPVFKRGLLDRYLIRAPQWDVIPLLHTVMVAPVTSTRRGAPGEVEVGVDEGLKHDSAVNLDHVHTVEQARLVGFVGTLSPAKMQEVCRALGLATGCA